MFTQVAGEDHEQEDIDKHDHVHEEEDGIHPEKDQCQLSDNADGTPETRTIVFYTDMKKHSSQYSTTQLFLAQEYDDMCDGFESV